MVLLHRAGLFDVGLVFKGGTALRKFRAGNSGRFSTDLDFSAPDEGLADLVLEELDGSELDGFSFVIENSSEARRGDLRVDTPFGSPHIGSKIELAKHPLTLEPEMVPPVGLPVHSRYGFELPSLPTIRVEEAIAEKLARYRRVSLARDLYDLHWFAESGAFDEDIVRRLWILKTYRDVVVDGRGGKPIAPTDITRPRDKADFRQEDIGHLTRPVRIEEWIESVRSRYAFVAELDEDEAKWIECNAVDLYAVNRALAPIRLSESE